MSEFEKRVRAEAEWRYARNEDDHITTTVRLLKREGFEDGAEFARTVTREEVDAFKRGWEEADARGESGSRVIAGLRAMGFEVER